jgi:pyruvate dehydrogenase E2 component (dihydrolipoamide acetyltransferase)
MYEVFMPKLSDTMEEGTVLKWHKKQGEKVQKGDVIAEVESDKATFELEAEQDGILAAIVVDEGGVAQVGATIAVIAAEGESLKEIPKASPKPSAAPPETQPAPTDVKEQEVGPPAEARRIQASPRARRLAADAGIDISQVKGTGPGGRITEADVEKFIEELKQKPAAPAPAREAQPATVYEEIKPSRMQAAIAQRMSISKTTVPHFYVTSEFDVEPLLRVKDELSAASETEITVTDILVKAVATALKKFPQVNSSWVDGSFRRHHQVNIGIAVAVPDGLVVPVVKNADKKNIVEISKEAKELIQKARENRLQVHEISDGTFTISNLGMYGVDEFAAIINPPESAILAVGAIKDIPVVKDGTIVISKRMRATLSVDHRVFYGAEAAEFMQHLKHLIESPLLLALA